MLHLCPSHTKGALCSVIKSLLTTGGVNYSMSLYSSHITRQSTLAVSYSPLNKQGNNHRNLLRAIELGWSGLLREAIAKANTVVYCSISCCVPVHPFGLILPHEYRARQMSLQQRQANDAFQTCTENGPCFMMFTNILRTHHLTRSSATAEIVRDAWNGHSRSLKVICCCVNRRGIYDFLLHVALSSNLTSTFNHSWDITPSLYSL